MLPKNLFLRVGAFWPCRQGGMGTGACSWSGLQCRALQKAEPSRLSPPSPPHGDGSSGVGGMREKA